VGKNFPKYGEYSQKWEKLVKRNERVGICETHRRDD
jgi:hypothetical protein